MGQMILADAHIDDRLTYDILYEMISKGTSMHTGIPRIIDGQGESRPPFTDEEGEGQREEWLLMSHREVVTVVGLAPSGNL